MIKLNTLHAELGIPKGAVDGLRRRGMINVSPRNAYMITEKEFKRIRAYLNRSSNLVKLTELAKEIGAKPSTLQSRITNGNLETVLNMADPSRNYVTEETAKELRTEFNNDADPTEGFILLSEFLKAAEFSDTKAYKLREKNLLTITRIGVRSYVPQEDYDKYCHVNEDTIESFFGEGEQVKADTPAEGVKEAMMSI